MSKGFIKICMEIIPKQNIDEHKYRGPLDQHIDRTVVMRNDCLYVSVKDITYVYKIKTWKEFYNYINKSSHDDENFHFELGKVFQDVYHEEIHKLADSESNKNCAYTNVLPLYIITCKIHIKHYDKYLNIIPYLQYVVDPNENDHMERVLKGTDDSIYDLVEELRYNPTIGLQVKKAKERFEKNAKKQKKIKF